MSLVYCPECGHEISQNAVACPNCGLPIQAPDVVVENNPVVPPPAVVRTRKEGIPPWAIALMGALGVLLLVVLFFLIRGNSSDSNVNVAMNANARRQAELNRSVATTNVPSTETQSVTVPGSQVPVTAGESAMPPSTTTIPGSATTGVTAPPPDKGTVTIRAKLMTKRGDQQPAKSAKFYLLDKDLDTILNEAKVRPIEGNSLEGSIGLAAVYPDRYGDFQRAAMRAIAAHAKYSGTTDGSGAAKIGSIAPKEYYLFAIVRVGTGFALWNSPVSVIPGDNMMDLSPQSITDISMDTGE
jgi:hypothetical protein